MGIGRLLLLLGVALGVWLAMRWFVRTPPEKVTRYLTRIAIAAIIVVLIVLAATGRLPPLFAAIGAAIGALFTLIQRLMRIPWVISLGQRFFYQYRARKASASSAGRRSQVETRFIRMFLDQDTGEMKGEIIAGAMAGRRLDDLELPQLSVLWREYSSVDPESAALLAAYLNRTYSENWRSQCGAKGGAGEGAPMPDARMTREEACKILGVEAGADREEIIVAHRRLVQRVHPDRGGSTYLAAKINRAKEVLLAKRTS